MISGVAGPGFFSVGRVLVEVWGAELSAAGGWESEEASSRGRQRVGGGAPSDGRFLQSLNENSAFLCTFRPK